VLLTITSLGEKAAVEAFLNERASINRWLGMNVANGKWVWTGAEGDVDTATIMTAYASSAPANVAGFAYAQLGVGTTYYSGDRSPSWSLRSLVEFDCY
jgi:hypothetical protein